MSERRKLSARGRIVAAGLSLGAAGVLAVAMAITDTTADATPSSTTTSNGDGSPNRAADGGSDGPAAPYTPDSGQPSDASIPLPAPQPQARTGGS